MLLVNLMVLGSMNNCFSLTYHEGADLTGQNLGVLDAGSNSVSGSVFLNSTSDPRVGDGDAFYFIVPNNEKVTSIYFDWSTIFTTVPSFHPSPDFSTLSWTINRDSIGGQCLYFQPYPAGTNHFLWTPSTEVGPGTYYIGQGFAYSGDGYNYSTTYEITINRSGGAPIPEPTTMLLMGTGLVGLIGVCRKTKA